MDIKTVLLVVSVILVIWLNLTSIVFSLEDFEYDGETDKDDKEHLSQTTKVITTTIKMVPETKKSSNRARGERRVLGLDLKDLYIQRLYKKPRNLRNKGPNQSTTTQAASKHSLTHLPEDDIDTPVEEMKKRSNLSKRITVHELIQPGLKNIVN